MSKIVESVTNTFKKIFDEDLSDYVCVIGGANIDVVGTAPVIKLGESNIGKISISPGGVSRNIAENLGKLGVPTVFIGAIGDDYFGQIVCDSLNESKVNLSGLRKIANKQTGSYMGVLDDFRNLSSAINDMGIISYVDKAWINKCSELISNAKLVVIDCNLRHEALEEIIKLSKSKIFVDAVSMAKSANIIPYISDLRAIKLNNLEAEIMTGIKVDSNEKGIEAIKVLLEKGIKNVAITLGECGVLVSDGKEIIHYSHKKVRPVNVTGAGDAFLAAWVYSQFNMLDFREAIKNSIVVAVKTVLTVDTVNKDLTKENFDRWKKEVEIYEEILEG